MEEINLEDLMKPTKPIKILKSKKNNNKKPQIIIEEDDEINSFNDKAYNNISSSDYNSNSIFISTKTSSKSPQKKNHNESTINESILSLVKDELKAIKAQQDKLEKLVLSLDDKNVI